VEKGNIPARYASRIWRDLSGRLRALARKAGDQEGNSLVEFAMASGILLAAVISIMGFSLVAYSYLYVSDAARQATRYAMVRGNTQTGDCTAPGPATCIAQTADIQSYVQNGALPGINGNNLSVTTTWLTSSGGSCGTADTCKSPGNYVKSTASYSYPLSLGYLPKQTFSISSTSQMMVAR
jgi:Flp pilus assembly protein TadG